MTYYHLSLFQRVGKGKGQLWVHRPSPWRTHPRRCKCHLHIPLTRELSHPATKEAGKYSLYLGQAWVHLYVWSPNTIERETPCWGTASSPCYQSWGHTPGFLAQGSLYRRSLAVPGEATEHWSWEMSACSVHFSVTADKDHCSNRYQ